MTAPNNDESSKRSGDGPARPMLPPPVGATPSMRRSIEALDAIESGAPRAASAGTAGAARTGTPAGSARPEDKASNSEKPQAAASQAPKVEPQLLRASAFRPNAPREEAAKTSFWTPPRKMAALAAITCGFAAAIFVPAIGLTLFKPSEKVAAKPSAIDLAREELRAVSRELAELRKKMDKADATKLRAQQRSDFAAVRKSLEDLSRKVETGRSAQTSALGDLAAKVERTRQEEAKQREDISARLGRLEKQMSDHRPTATIAPLQNTTTVTRAAVTPPPPTPPVAPARENDSADNAKSQRLAGYVLREVYKGVALVEGRYGYVEVYPGMALPGAGRVQKIERRSGRWVVVTSNGYIGPQVY